MEPDPLSALALHWVSKPPVQVVEAEFEPFGGLTEVELIWER